MNRLILILTGSMLLYPLNLRAEEMCSAEALGKNLDVAHDIGPAESNKFIIEPPSKAKFISIEKRIPCMESDLLKNGFDYKGSSSGGPNNSTNGIYENSDVFQKGPVLVRCYYEMDLTDRGRNSRVVWSRVACQQIVPVRVRDVP